MIIKDLLTKCNPEAVVNAILVKFEKAKEEDKENIKNTYLNVYAELREKTPILSDRILLKIPFVDDGERIDFISVYSKKEIKEKIKECPEIENVEIEKVKEFSMDEVSKILSSANLPSSYSLSFVSWSKIVGYELDEENVKEYGEEEILADVLSEITFHGFTEEEIEKEKAALDKIVAEVKEVKEKGKEAEAAYFKTADEVFKEFHCFREQTEEEKEKEREIIKREILYNTKETYKVLKEIKKRI